MPYITNENRWALQSRYAQTPGELNYQISKLLTKYVRTKGLSYQTINDIMGVVDCAGKEFYRRVALPYENTKLSQNGDVYNYDLTTPETL